MVEPSFGIDRTVLSIIMVSIYTRENGSKVLKLNTSIAPYIASILPLQKKDGVDVLAKDIYSSILETESRIQYDESGSIGRRYARQDEVGTPY